MRGVILFLAGVLVGIFAMQPSSAQTDKILSLSHVGISVENFDEQFNFYTKTMGFREAFTLRGQDGKPTISYLQINNDTFVELLAANANRPPGLHHLGLEVENVQATTTRLRQQDVKVEAPRVGGPTKALLTNATGPSGITIELLEFGPDSLQRKAIDSYR